MSIWKYSSPQYFYPLAKKMATIFFVAAAVLTVWGLYTVSYTHLTLPTIVDV